MKEQILKLAKRLNNFSIDDIQIMLGMDEKEIIECIDELVDRKQIKKNSENSYTFIKLQYVAKLNVNDYNPQGINLSEADIKAYSSADKSARKFADKYLMIIEGSNGLRGKPLQRFIDEWNAKNPTMKTSASRIHSARKKLLSEGISGLLGKTVKIFKDRKTIYEPIYIYFRELYLAPQMLTSMQALDIAVEKYMKENPKFDTLTLTKPQTYRKRLQSEYTVEEINFHRSNYLNKELSINLKLNTTFFKDAAIEYIEKHALENCTYSTVEGYRNQLKIHLLPFFGDKKLAEINDELIEDFKSQRLDNGLSAKSVNNMITLLTSIIRIYNENYSTKKVIIEKDSIKLNILSTEQINLMLKAAREKDLELYYILIAVILTGITRGELLGLTWDKIDWENQQIIIDKALCRGKIVTHKNNNSKRIIDVSTDLLDLLKEFKPKLKDYVNIPVFQNKDGKTLDPDNLAKRKFEPFMSEINLKNTNFIDLRDTYASLLIKQNLPLTYIQKQLGHSSVQVTAERYKVLLEQKQVKNLNILDGVL
jgi:integrase